MTTEAGGAVALALSLWQWQSALNSRDELRDVHIPAAAKREADVREQLQQCQAAQGDER